MYNENYVIFKGTKDGVTVIFDPEVSFETLCTQLEKKVAEAGKFFDKDLPCLQGACVYGGGGRNPLKDYRKAYHDGNYLRENRKQRNQTSERPSGEGACAL